MLPLLIHENLSVLMETVAEVSQGGREEREQRAGGWEVHSTQVPGCGRKWVLQESAGGPQLAGQRGGQQGSGWAQRLFLQVVQKEEEFKEVAQSVLPERWSS